MKKKKADPRVLALLDRIRKEDAAAEIAWRKLCRYVNRIRQSRTRVRRWRNQIDRIEGESQWQGTNAANSPPAPTPTATP